MTATKSRPIVAAPSPRPAPSLTRQQETAALGDAIAELSSRIQAATYELLVMIREFDERGGWGEGFRSCAHWLNWRTGLALGAAREKVRVARALGALPLLSAEMRRGALSYSKARALTRVATPENEEGLVGFALSATAAHVERLVRSWRRVDRIDDAEEESRRHASRHLDLSTDEDGMVVVRGRVSPEVGAVLRQALDGALERLYEQEGTNRGAKGRGASLAGPAEPATARETSAGQRRADALGLVAESALSSGLAAGSAGDRYQVVLHVDETRLAPRRSASVPRSSAGRATLDADLDVPAETSRRMACDASRVVVRHGARGTVLDVGRKTRTVPPALRRALVTRDRRCRFPGCESRHCDAHHVRHWADGGETRLDNLVLLCRRHHRAVHEEGVGVRLMPDGSARFRWPDGRPMPEAPLPPVWRGTPLAPIDRVLAASVVVIDADTATPAWYGERLDLDWAVAVLR